MIKGVIFDMDGLMIDSEPLQSEAIAVVLKEYGKDPIFKKNKLIHTVGLKGHEQWAEIRKTHGIDEDIEILREKRRKAYIKIVQKNGVKTMPGVISLLKQLKEKGDLKIGLASNTALKHILLILNKIKVRSYFNLIISADHVKNAKPHPDIYLKAAKGLKLDPGDCLVLEDSQSGVIAAKKAGMYVIAVPSRFTNHQDFSQSDLIVPSLAKITWEIIRTF